MKNLLKEILFVLAVSGSGSASCQVFNYFGNIPIWYQSSVCTETTGDCELQSEFMYYVDGDTDIVSIGELYYKIRKNGTSEYVSLDTSTEICSGSFEFHYLAALLRQEGRKIFMYDVALEEEVLLWDFSLGIGDTLPLTPVQQLADVIIEDIDSFAVGIDYLYKFYISSPEPAWIIEGIGSSNGLLEDMVPSDDCVYTSGCLSINGNTVWQSSASAECGYAVGLEEVSESSQLRVFPNPLNAKLSVTGLTEGNNYAIDITDQSGRTVISAAYSSMPIDVSNLSGGIYLLHVKGNGISEFIRFVKM